MCGVSFLLGIFYALAMLGYAGLETYASVIYLSGQEPGLVFQAALAILAACTSYVSVVFLTKELSQEWASGRGNQDDDEVFSGQETIMMTSAPSPMSRLSPRAVMRQMWERHRGSGRHQLSRESLSSLNSELRKLNI